MIDSSAEGVALSDWILTIAMVFVVLKVSWSGQMREVGRAAERFRAGCVVTGGKVGWV